MAAHDVPRPSLLPGWTRGHVLAHLARNADGYRRLLEGARTGTPVQRYPSEASRQADIDAGASRTVDEHLADIWTSAGNLDTAFENLPLEAWTVPVVGRSGTRAIAAALVWWRLREVEVHHVDLDSGYGPRAWTDSFVLRLLHDLESGLVTDPPARMIAMDLEREYSPGPADGPSLTVAGSGHALAAWLIGREDGASLTVRPAGPLPSVPGWK
ncbi:MAG: maleylpyruvate isomerase family mycothiol-dependent enzyme [Dactylosporangium sp.]|nr:maleylpyruvate isomerase family mycothiol-dependent enzyme [Dactylosporangium sp.]NNJ60753.1 maleylpyruvate isomerase family mycothiol-dependent enzyme [Dactylosporangium sp.]